MKKLVIVLFLSLFAQTAFSQESTFESDIRELLELTGSAKLGVQVANQMIGNFKQALPDVPEEFWNEFANNLGEDDLINLVIPIYMKYYTEDDIQQLIEFYKTPIGKKTIKVLPQITQDSMLAGQEWGRKLGEKIAEDLMDRGYINK